jgi:hypothetical protein
VGCNARNLLSKDFLQFSNWPSVAQEVFGVPTNPALSLVWLHGTFDSISVMNTISMKPRCQDFPPHPVPEFSENSHGPDSQIRQTAENLLGSVQRNSIE